jgi:NAD(P)-dependent dehydrogenase (short-subunit alcohol dehydrogenase family)
MSTFESKSIVITGGSGGIGLATARIIVEKGGSVLLVDINQDALKEAVQELGSDRASYVVADVSKEEEVANFFKIAEERMGTIDGFFNNAGVEGVVKPLTEYTEKEFRHVMDVNVMGVWFGLKYAFPAMKKNGGSIVITSSVAGLQGTASMIAYTTSKHAIIGTMKVAAIEGAQHNIRVNSIHPGPIDNRMMRSLEEGFSPGAGEAVKSQFEQMIPLKRYGTSEDVANLAAFLFSDEASYLTGAQYRVDGGMGA